MSKILIVDDERVFCDMLKALMKNHGHEVFAAYGGPEAIALFAQHRPQFTLLDLHMPDMDGIETLRQIRAIDQHAAVMILTAWGTVELEQQARRLGVIDFLSKSLSLDTIIASMERGLKPPAPPPIIAALPLDKQPDPPSISDTDAVFLVEWDIATRKTFVQVLGQYGITIKSAQDGPTLLHMLSKQRPQLVALDMDVPGLNGLDMLQKIRETQYSGGIIIMTDRQDERLLKEAIALGSIDILGKPVAPERLMLAIQVGLVLLRA